MIGPRISREPVTPSTETVFVVLLSAFPSSTYSAWWRDGHCIPPDSTGDLAIVDVDADVDDYDKLLLPR